MSRIVNVTLAMVEKAKASGHYMSTIALYELEHRREDERFWHDGAGCWICFRRMPTPTQSVSYLTHRQLAG